jgi:hypothetical protein
MKYVAQRHRLDALEAALGRPGAVVRIEGGLPVDAPMPPSADPQPKVGTSAPAATDSAGPEPSPE